MTTPATKKTTAATDSAATNPKGKTLAPRVDVGESADEFVIVANIPGSSLDDIDISFEAHKMHLLAKVVSPIGQSLKDEEPTYQVDEYLRSFDLEVCGFDIDRVTAVYQNGILTVRLPKAEALRPRRINVEKG